MVKTRHSRGSVDDCYGEREGRISTRTRRHASRRNLANVSVLNCTMAVHLCLVCFMTVPGGQGGRTFEQSVWDWNSDDFNNKVKILLCTMIPWNAHVYSHIAPSIDCDRMLKKLQVTDMSVTYSLMDHDAPCWPVLYLIKQPFVYILFMANANQ